ncbi:MAG: 30S ribosomal protein S8 [Cryomorphaceae bacterium]|jgi:small subunit ribosomal protein S8|nr:30S ribosomal protein S8 [Cryomorphaceae bacterium]
MLSDPISDFLTRIRNASMAGHKVVVVPASNLRLDMCKIMHEQGYILNYKKEETENKQGQIKIALKYNPVTKQPAIRTLKRVSRPGLRRYNASDDLPRVLNGLGIAIVSTNKGVMTDKQARQEKVGGEVLCLVY